MTPSKNQDSDFKNLQDPYAQREAEKYEHPIPSRELILQLIQQIGKPLRRQQIAEQFALETPDELEALRRRLRAMERDGQLIFNSRQKYFIDNGRQGIAGRVLGHPDGFGFLKPDDGTDDLYISPRAMKTLMHNDRIRARVSGIDRKGRREAVVEEILEHNTHQIVGRFYIEGHVAYVVPDNKKINHEVLIAKEDIGGAKNGQIVVVEIVQQATAHCQPLGKVTEILGLHMAPGMEIEMAIRSYELPNVWPNAVLKEISGMQPEVPETAKQNRLDIRKLPLVTIDGEDARDFDDAVYAQKTEKGWKLLVAIADVSHYVQVGTALDAEAKNRSTSVYFPEKVIPMLPEILSNGLCSLNPHVDRLCMVCEMLINQDGVVTRSRFFEAVMRSHARLTYTDVAKMLVEGDQRLIKINAQLMPHLQNLYDLYKAVRSQRELRGALDFDTQETRIVFGANRKIEQIVPVVRNDAHKLIEEFMIAANTAAAKFLNRLKMPRLLRIHNGPGSEKLLSLKTFLSELGLHLGGGNNPRPLDYMHLLDSVKQRQDAHLIQTVLLRSMSQAVYSPENVGHFGLALEAYAHFTSPIRRYPDLLVHRAIRHSLSKQSVAGFSYNFNDMVLLGEHCSANERRADEATRDVINWLKCEYMMDKIGQEFAGIISAVTGFGFFVELQSIFVEGLVHIASLQQDYFNFDAVSHQLYGERTGLRYRLGDAVLVRVVRVNLDDKKIDFELLQDGQKSAKSKKSAKSTKAKDKNSVNTTATKAKSAKDKPAAKSKRKK
ncbi:MAG: ribonuclease R [Methylomonas sp.]|jgi:ribonuclease R